MGLLGNIISLLVILVACLFLRFSQRSPLFSVFHYDPPLNPAFTGNCVIFPAGTDQFAHPEIQGFSYAPHSAEANAIDLKKLADQLGMRNPHAPHHFVLVNEYGHQVSSPSDCQRRHGHLYLMRKRDLWSWPAISVGNNLEIDVTETFGDFTLYNLKTLSVNPHVMLVEGLISAEEISQIKETASGKLVAAGEGLGSRAFVNGSDHRVFARLDHRITEILRVPEMLVRGVEGFEVLRHRAGDSIPARSDYLTEENEDKSHHINLKRNYLATVTLYLDEAEAGGETCIPKVESDGDLSAALADPECANGLKFKPKAGSAVIVYNLDTKDIMYGVKNPKAARAETPVKKGEKWVAVRKVYNKGVPVDAVIWTAEKGEQVPYGFIYNYPVLPGDE